MPDTENPAKTSSDAQPTTYGVVDLSESEYHEISDVYLENVLVKFEALQDTREDLDIEFSVRFGTLFEQSVSGPKISLTFIHYSLES